MSQRVMNGGEGVRARGQTHTLTHTDKAHTLAQTRTHTHTHSHAHMHTHQQAYLFPCFLSVKHPEKGKRAV